MSAEFAGHSLHPTLPVFVFVGVASRQTENLANSHFPSKASDLWTKTLLQFWRAFLTAQHSDGHAYFLERNCSLAISRALFGRRPEHQHEEKSCTMCFVRLP